MFVEVFRWGLVGAAVATAFSQFVGGVIPLIYFILPNKSLLRIKKAKFGGKVYIELALTVHLN